MMVGFFRKRHFLNPFDSPTGFTRLRFGQSLIPPSLPWFNLLATDSSEKFSLARLDHQTERYSVQMRSACFCCLWLLCTSLQWAGIVWGWEQWCLFSEWYQLTFEETQLLQSFQAESYWSIPKPKRGSCQKWSSIWLHVGVGPCVRLFVGP